MVEALHVITSAILSLFVGTGFPGKGRSFRSGRQRLGWVTLVSWLCLRQDRRGQAWVEPSFAESWGWSRVKEMFSGCY